MEQETIKDEPWMKHSTIEFYAELKLINMQSWTKHKKLIK